MDKTPSEIVDALLVRLFELAGKTVPTGQRFENMRTKIKREAREAVKLQGAGIAHTQFNEIFG